MGIRILNGDCKMELEVLFSSISSNGIHGIPGYERIPEFRFKKRMGFQDMEGFRIAELRRDSKGSLQGFRIVDYGFHNWTQMDKKVRDGILKWWTEIYRLDRFLRNTGQGNI